MEQEKSGSNLRSYLHSTNSRFSRLMKLLYNTQTQLLQPYPRKDDEEVVGLDPMYRVFDVIQNSPPDSVPAGYTLRPTQAIDAEAKTVTRGFELVAIIPIAPIWPNVQAFMAAFTMEEKAVIALSVDPTIAALRLELTTWFSTVDPSHELVQTGLNKLVETGIISADRKAEIIATASAN